jgi:UTP--glucose-1-phosphate uridylyltransferase
MGTIRKAVITAAGRGTRQYPATSVVQKEMLPLVDRDGITKPAVQIIAEEAFDAGIEEICIVVSPGDEPQFRQYFRAISQDVLPAFAGKEWALRESEKLSRMERALNYAVQQTPEGFGHAVYQSREFVGNEPFLLLLGDHIYISQNGHRCASQLIDAYHANNADVMSAVKRTPSTQLHQFGTIRGLPVGDSNRLYSAAAVEEKPSVDHAMKHLATPGLPAGQFLCHFGMHVFSPAVFDCLEYLIRNEVRSRGEIQLTTAQQLLLNRTRGYYCCEVSGERYDTGVPFGLMEAQLALALSGMYRHEIVESVARLLAQQLRSVSANGLRLSNFSD